MSTASLPLFYLDGPNQSWVDFDGNRLERVRRAVDRLEPQREASGHFPDRRIRVDFPDLRVPPQQAVVNPAIVGPSELENLPEPRLMRIFLQVVPLFSVEFGPL